MIISMDADYDIIVIGSGAGGGTLAFVCAAAGKRVLLVERGAADVTSPYSPQNGAPRPHNESETLIQKRPYDDREIELNGSAARLYMGGMIGGGTSVYGGALLKPHPEDFSPGKYYRSRIPAEIHHWPISFETLRPYLSAAEQLYLVRDVADTHIGADTVLPNTATHAIDLANGSVAVQKDGLPLVQINKTLTASALQMGLNPYRLPLAIDPSKCLRCDHCAGFVCPTGARRSSSQLVAQSISRGDSLTLRTQCEAHLFEREAGNRLKGIWLKDRTTGTLSFVRAKRYVLAGGAIGSAALLLKSGIEHPMTGRNFMMHFSPVVIGLFWRSTGASETFVKQIGISDFYYGTKNLPEKMGIVQSLPAPGPLMMAKSGMKRVPLWVLRFLRARMLPLVGIVEDLPSPENRVLVDPAGSIRLHHQFTDYDRERGAELSRQMSTLLSGAGAIHCVTGLAPSAEHVAHQCGTIRFGSSRKHAVADPDCRLFSQPDVFVADGSFMPTSLGVGPSLTIIANAIRVAGIVASEV